MRQAPAGAVEALRALLRLSQAYPLARATLWNSTRTSQRVAASRVMASGVLVGIILGGNRSGKTEAGAQIAVAYALGRDHPAVQLWARTNKLDVSGIQPGPGVVCCSALTGEDSLRVQRPKVETYLPEGTDWTRRNSHQGAVARLPGGGVIIFKSNDQRRRAFQGADWDFLWMDEEHDEDVFNEGRMRLVDRGGRALFSMTPLRGRTWVYRRFVKEPEENSTRYALNSRDNPHVPQEYLSNLLAKYGPHERAARERGEFATLEGRVYEFSAAVHVVPSFPIPNEWPRYMGADMGVRNATAILWVAHDLATDTLHVYREHYRTGWTTRQHAEHVLSVEVCPSCEGTPEVTAGHELLQLRPDAYEAENVQESESAVFRRHALVQVYHCRSCRDHPGRTEPKPRWRAIDPAAADARKTFLKHHSLKFKPAPNDVRQGINSVSERLTPDAAGRPHLLVHDCCHNVISEFEGYVWDTSRTKGDPKDHPLKSNDHAMDALRYAVYQLQKRGVFGVTA